MVVDERRRLAARTYLPPSRNGSGSTNRMLANATSYGVYAEMQRRESTKPVAVEYTDNACKGQVGTESPVQYP